MLYEFRWQHEAPTTVYHCLAQLTNLQTHQATWSRKANTREKTDTEANSESNRLIRFKYIYTTPPF